MRRTSTSRISGSPPRHVLASRRAGKREARAGARERRGVEERHRTPSFGRSGALIRDADTRIGGGRSFEADDEDAAGHEPPSLLGRRVASRGEASVRRDVLDAEVLHEPDLRPRGGRRRGDGEPFRGEAGPVHPRRGLRGQRSCEGVQPLGARVGPRDGAVDLRRRAGRKILERFEGAVSVRELERTVRDELLGGA